MIIRKIPIAHNIFLSKYFQIVVLKQTNIVREPLHPSLSENEENSFIVNLDTFANAVKFLAKNSFGIRFKKLWVNFNHFEI